MYNAPLLPELELPVLSTNNPLTPELPAFAVRRSSTPLLVAVPKPVVNDTNPPVADADVPAISTISPPDPVVPDPTVT